MKKGYSLKLGYAAGKMMLKWKTLDNKFFFNQPFGENIDNKPINVFINLENILSHLYTYKRLPKAIEIYKQEIVLDIESSILNMIAHYMIYFKRRKYSPKLYFYFTNLDTEKQEMKIYNQFYRDYYHNKYLSDPRFKHVGETFKDIILPELKLIISYLPNVYLLESKYFDSSIIPMVVNAINPSLNVIITRDQFDASYFLNENFNVLYIDDLSKGKYVFDKKDSYLSWGMEIYAECENEPEETFLNNELYYYTYKAITGDKIRNIEVAREYKEKEKLINLLFNKLTNGIIMGEYKSVNSIINIFPSEYIEKVKMAINCVNLNVQYDLISENDKELIKDQLIDKVDISSLEKLNSERFQDFPINISGLI